MPDDAAYQVFWLPAARQVLQAFADNTTDPEIRAEVARIVRLLDQRLRTDPLLVGEVYRTRGAVHEHLAVRDLLSVDFAVDTAHKLVAVRRCTMCSRESS